MSHSSIIRNASSHCYKLVLQAHFIDYHFTLEQVPQYDHLEMYHKQPFDAEIPSTYTQSLLYFYELYKLVMVKHTTFINLINPRLKKFIIQTLKTTTTATSKHCKASIPTVAAIWQVCNFEPFGAEGRKKHYSWPWRKQILASRPKSQNFGQMLFRTKHILKVSKKASKLIKKSKATEL